MVQKQIRILLLLMLMFIIASCSYSLTRQNLKPVTQEEQNAIIWMDVYHSVYKDSMAVMKNPNSTPVQVDIALKQKSILIQVWPLLKEYTAPIDPTNPNSPMTGGDPTVITQLINQLITLTTQEGVKH